ncbi:hypothetical protein D7Y04_40280 [Corallococcus sp. AB038B]|nr:hypothetical protein D7Y04_40280 [Corallococcus sp. AB038B]
MHEARQLRFGTQTGLSLVLQRLVAMGELGAHLLQFVGVGAGLVARKLEADVRRDVRGRWPARLGRQFAGNPPARLLLADELAGQQAHQARGHRLPFGDFRGLWRHGATAWAGRRRGAGAHGVVSCSARRGDASGCGQHAGGMGLSTQSARAATPWRQVGQGPECFARTDSEATRGTWGDGQPS